jgi:hypothetical protein
MSDHTNETSQADGAGEPQAGAADGELSEAQLETAAGGGLGDAIQWAIDKFNEAGQKIVQAASGGMLP